MGVGIKPSEAEEGGESTGSASQVVIIGTIRAGLYLWEDPQCQVRYADIEVTSQVLPIRGY